MNTYFFCKLRTQYSNYHFSLKATFFGFQGIRSDKVPEELWMVVRDIVQEAGIKTIPKQKKKKKNAKRKNGCLRKPYKELRKEEKLKAKEKRKDIPI